MSYMALYRKYRPKTFDEIAGQQAIVRTLKNAINNDKISHAYLFCGPRGTGKTSTAKIFARAINCTGEQVLCGECDNCKASIEQEHPDIIEIDAASNNGVEEVRNLIEKVKYAPLKGKYKIYIIDEVHMMSKSAYNALLKTIEEPPKHVIFIFATTEPHKVLPTILSRCQRYDFHKVPKKEMVERMQSVADAEKINIDLDALNVIADLSDGGMRDALSILDQCCAYNSEKIAVNDVLEVYGVVSIDEQVELLLDITAKNTESVINKINDFNNRGINIKRLTASLISILKDRVVYEMSGIKTIVNDEQFKKLYNAEFSTSAMEKIDILMETYSKYQFASDDETYFQIACVKMIGVNTETLPSMKVENAVERIEENPVKNDEVTQNSNEHNIDVSRETKKEIDEEYYLSLLVGANKQSKAKDNDCIANNDLYLNDMELGKYANLLKGCTIIASSDNYIVVSVEDNSIANQINEFNINNEFNDYSSTIFGRKKKVFGISKDKVDSLLSKFRERMKSNTLPIAAEVVVVDTEESKVDLIKGVFGDKVVVEE